MIEFEFVTFCFALFAWLGFCSQFSYRVSPALTLAVLYTGARALWQWVYPLSTREAHMLIGMNLSLTAIVTLVMGVIVVGWPRRAVQIVGCLLHQATIISAVVLAFFPELKPTQWIAAGLILNPALNASIAVCTLPFFVRVWEKSPAVSLIGLFSTITIVLASRSMTPCLCFAVLCFANHSMARRNGKKYEWVLRAVYAAAPILAVGILLDATGDNQRVQWWGFYFREWLANFSWTWGAGPNQFFLIGPLLQLGVAHTETWVHLHSDILQILFELGCVGVLLWLLVVRKALKQSRENFPEFYSAGIAFLVPLAIYFPLHTSTGSLLAAILLWPLAHDKMK